ncbi:hypothetical protein HQQ80_11390 [Microbacteriaceae bacterium VKM Ac-2855]|nr:hypothetical protein [Microbacteriaceae bacterium VKM Ac-2855]
MIARRLLFAAAAGCALALTGCAPSAAPGSGSVFGGNEVRTITDAFPVLETAATDVDALPPGSDVDLNLDPGSTRFIVTQEDRGIWIATDDDGSTVCIVSIPVDRAGDGISGCGTPQNADAVSGMVIATAVPGVAELALWAEGSDAEAESAGWTELGDNLWTR